MFFRELGPDNVFVHAHFGGPGWQHGAPKERKRRYIKPEYVDFIKQSCFSVEDVGLRLVIPNVVNGNSLTARVPGYESDDINISATTPEHRGDLAARFEEGRFFTPEENHRGSHVVMIGRSLSDDRCSRMAGRSAGP